MYNQREKKMNTYLMNMLEDHLCVKKIKDHNVWLF